MENLKKLFLGKILFFHYIKSILKYYIFKVFHFFIVF
jgi:hypothetical protein